MKNLKGACMFAQSGGPTSVINASAAGVFIEALAQKDAITAVYGAAHGIRGVLTEDFYDISKEDIKEICKKFCKYRNVYFIWDKWNLLDEKDSPADANNKTYNFLMKYKIKYLEKE